jgi:hypothetical protein
MASRSEASEAAVTAAGCWMLAKESCYDALRGSTRGRCVARHSVFKIKRIKLSHPDVLFLTLPIS